MGCWNETCGISQLPILSGDNIRAFVLARSSSHRSGGGGFCYQDDVWIPYGFPIQGKYNDYGSIEKVKKDHNSKLLFNKIVKNINLEKYDEERHFHVDLKSKKLSWTQLVTAISQEELKLKDAEPGIMFVLEDVYQSMIKMNKVHTTRDKGGYLYEKLDKVIDNDIVQYFNKLHRIATKKANLTKQIENNKNDPNNLKLDLEIKLDLLGDMLDDNYNSVISSTLGGHKSLYMKFYKEELTNLAAEGKGLEDKSIKEIFKALREYICFNFIISDLRKGWQPQFGKGSQDNETLCHVMLSNTILDICKKRNAEWEKENIGEQWSEYELSEWQIKHNEEELKRRGLLAFA